MLNQNEYGVLSAILIWLVAAFLPCLFRQLKNIKVFFVPSFVASLLVIYFASLSLGQVHPTTISLPLGLPDFPFLIRLDSLSSLFLIILGLTSAGITIHASSYFKNIKASQFRSLFLFYHLLLVGMTGVFISNDGYSFLITWELMALSSYFLVIFNHHSQKARQAGFIYLLLSHVGAIALLLSLGIMAHGNANYSFDVLRHLTLTPGWKEAAFLLAFLGFGFKAGLVPFHVWLPEAYPAAPSPISALMSAVMVKTSIYGFLRFAFDLQGGVFPTWIGLSLVVIGLLSGFYGVIYAVIQVDMKRLLAFSSIENMGIIFAVTGLSLTFYSMHKIDLCALALVAVLYHCISHAFFKSLLFLATGNVLHATGERNLGKLGGLIRFMPWVAMLSLIGCISMAGLPPSNGFVSEWLMIQSFLAFAELPESYLTLILPLCAALFIFIVGLAGFMSVKFFGIIFLGQPREKELSHAKDAFWIEKIALIYFAVSCVILGVFPKLFISYIKSIVKQLLSVKEALGIFPDETLTVIPISVSRASYSPLLIFIFLLILTLSIFGVLHTFYKRKVRRADPWACGLEKLSYRMQDTAEGFGQPLKQVFGQFMRIDRNILYTQSNQPKYVSVIDDVFWVTLYVFIAKMVQSTSNVISIIQRGGVNIYMLYGLITLIILLVVVRWI